LPVVVLEKVEGVRVFRNKAFSRYARKEKIADDELKQAVDQLQAGAFDADLGGEVYKMRVAGEGKRSSYRVIILFRSGDKAFFVHGFAKSNMANISDKALKNLKKDAKAMLAMNEEQIDASIKSKELQEI
jgi:hypothetical protein